jgi:hypothetical protein
MNSRDKADYISLTEAAANCQYSQEYLSLRARQGKLKAVKLGRNWVTTPGWLDDYLQQVDESKTEMKLATQVAQSDIQPQQLIENEFVHHPTALAQSQSATNPAIEDRLETEKISPTGQNFSWQLDEPVTQTATSSRSLEKVWESAIKEEVDKSLAEDPFMMLEVSNLSPHERKVARKILNPDSTLSYQDHQVPSVSQARQKIKGTPSPEDFWPSFKNEGHEVYHQLINVARPLTAVTAALLFLIAFLTLNQPYRITESIVLGAQTVGQQLASPLLVSADEAQEAQEDGEIALNRSVELAISELEEIELDLPTSIALNNLESYQKAGRVAGAQTERTVEEMGTAERLLYTIGVGVKTVFGQER